MVYVSRKAHSGRESPMPLGGIPCARMGGGWGKHTKDLASRTCSVLGVVKQKQKCILPLAQRNVRDTEFELALEFRQFLPSKEKPARDSPPPYRIQMQSAPNKLVWGRGRGEGGNRTAETEADCRTRQSGVVDAGL